MLCYTILCYTMLCYTLYLCTSSAVRAFSRPRIASSSVFDHWILNIYIYIYIHICVSLSLSLSLSLSIYLYIYIYIYTHIEVESLKHAHYILISNPSSSTSGFRGGRNTVGTYIWIYSGREAGTSIVRKRPVSEKTLLLLEPWPCDPAAETAIEPQIWCFQSWFSKLSSCPEECFFTDTGMATFWKLINLRGWRNTVGNLVDIVRLKQTCQRLQCTGIGMKRRGVRFHRIRGFNKCYFKSDYSANLS